MSSLILLLKIAGQHHLKGKVILSLLAFLLNILHQYWFVSAVSVTKKDLYKYAFKHEVELGEGNSGNTTRNKNSFVLLCNFLSAHDL